MEYKIAEDMKLFADNMPQIIWKADNHGNFHYANVRWSEFTASPHPSNIFDFIHADDKERVKSLWSKSLEAKVPLESEFRIRRRDGQFKWHLTQARPEINSDGEVVFWYGTSTNTEEQNLLAQELSIAHLTVESERQKFETLFQSAPAAMAILKGPSFIFERANKEYLKAVQNRDVIGKALLEVLPEFLDHPEFLNSLYNVYQTGETFSAKDMKSILPIIDDDGKVQPRYMDVSYMRMNTPTGEPYGVFVFAVDVTEKFMVRKKIQESESEFRALTEVMPQIIFIVNPKGEIIYLNERWELYTGHSAIEGQGKNWLFFHHPDDIEAIEQEWKNSLIDGSPFQLEYRLKGQNGEYRWFLARALPMRDDKGRILRWIGTKTDIHEQKILSQKLESLLGEIKSSKELAESANHAKSAFLANMSHEIRTPLGSIMGFINLMRNPNLSPSELNRYISITEKNSEQLLRIIDDILDLSKVEAGKLVIEKIDFNLTDLLADIASLMEFRAQENGIKFIIRATNELPEIINGDPTRIKQILMNAVGNAIKFTLKGTVELQVSFYNSRLRFTITDTGVGISEKQASQLFQAFTQADISTTRKYGGTGLGLILTKRLCETMGGEFYLQKSQLGVGSTFVATIRVDAASDTKFFTEPKSHFYTPATLVMDHNALKGKNIMVVDDLEDNLTLIEVILQSAGAKAALISDPLKGLQTAVEGNFDLILMDIQMPHLNGYELTTQIRQSGLKIPIIALTAHAMKDEKMRALNFGFSGFLPKPINAVDLINAILELTSNKPSTKSIAIVEDDPDLRELLEALLRNQHLDVSFMETAEDLLDHLKEHSAPELIMVDLFLPKMSGAELIPLLNSRSDRAQFKVVIASGSDDISSNVKNLRADGYLKKPYNSRSIVESIKAFLL